MVFRAEYTNYIGYVLDIDSVIDALSLTREKLEENESILFEDVTDHLISIIDETNCISDYSITNLAEYNEDTGREDGTLMIVTDELGGEEQWGRNSNSSLVGVFDISKYSRDTTLEGKLDELKIRWTWGLVTHFRTG